MLNEKIVLDKIWFSAGSRCGHGEHLPPWSLFKALQNPSFAQCSNYLCRLCQCCRTGALALNRYGWVGIGICRCWAVTLHVPGIPSRMKVALGRRHRHCCTPVFLWAMLYQAYVLFSFMSQMFMEHRECPELAAAAGCRCGMGSIPLLCPALPHLLCTRSLAVLTQLGLALVALDTQHGASLCQHQRLHGQRVQEHSSQQLRAGSLCSCLLFHWAP